MIDPISAFSMLTTAHSALKKMVSMGRDLSSATKYVTQYAKAEAELGFAKEQKKKGIFGSVMDQAIEQHFKEEEQKRLKDELRSLFLLYGADGLGQWERLQATIASARAEHRKRLKEQQRIRDRNLMITVGVVSFILGIGILIMFINYLKYGSAF
tara:strand:+ start:610 stop:1074 length:465 start_codon:yes stop_codon:yes gene_type:complete